MLLLIYKYRYHDALSTLSYNFVHLVEEAFGIPIGTFDKLFFPRSSSTASSSSSNSASSPTSSQPSSTTDEDRSDTFLPPQHRIKLLKYPSTTSGGQGVGPHKDSSGWLTFLYQPDPTSSGLEVLSNTNTWMPAPPIPGTFVVNFGNAFEAATEGAVRATIHRVIAPTTRDRYSIPFFMGLPLDLTVSEIREFIPEDVRALRREKDGDGAVGDAVSPFLDKRWDCLGESQLRKWIRSHEDVGRKWYGDEVCGYYLAQ
jgi:hypothetical protein